MGVIITSLALGESITETGVELLRANQVLFLFIYFFDEFVDMSYGERVNRFLLSLLLGLKPFMVIDCTRLERTTNTISHLDGCSFNLN